MGKWLIRFFGYYAINSIVTIGLIFLYGTIDPFAGYFLFFIPVSVWFATIIMLGIKYKFPDINKYLFHIVLSPALNILTLIGVIAALILLENFNMWSMK